VYFDEAECSQVARDIHNTREGLRLTSAHFDYPGDTQECPGDVQRQSVVDSKRSDVTGG